MDRVAVCCICFLALHMQPECDNPMTRNLDPPQYVRLPCTHVYHLSCLLESLHFRLGRILPLRCEFCRSNIHQCEIFSGESTIWTGNVLRDDSVFGIILRSNRVLDAETNFVEEMEPTLLRLIRVVTRAGRILPIPDYVDDEQPDELASDPDWNGQEDVYENLYYRNSDVTNPDLTNSSDLYTTMDHSGSAEMIPINTDRTIHESRTTSPYDNNSLTEIEIISISDYEEENHTSIRINAGGYNVVEQQELVNRTPNNWIPEALELFQIPVGAHELYRIRPEILELFQTNSNRQIVTQNTQILLNALEPESTEPRKRRWKPEIKLLFKLIRNSSTIIPPHVESLFDQRHIIEMSQENTRIAETDAPVQNSNTLQSDPCPGPSSYTCLHRNCNLRFSSRAERDNHHRNIHSIMASTNLEIQPNSKKSNEMCTTVTYSDPTYEMEQENNSNMLNSMSEEDSTGESFNCEYLNCVEHFQTQAELDNHEVNDHLTCLPRTPENLNTFHYRHGRRLVQLDKTKPKPKRSRAVEPDTSENSDSYGKKSRMTPNNPRRPSGDGDDDGYLCSICGQTLSTMSGLRAHERTYHQI